MAATEAALEAAAGAGKLRFGGPHGAGAAFLARKQRIEATVGFQVPEDNSRRHLLTLTVGDYKRRRGLL
ncbi:Protein RTF1, partial [Ancistrocladus abbreviatus]